MRKHDEINFQSHNSYFPIRRLNKPNLYHRQWCSASDGKIVPTLSPINETAIVDIPEADDRDVEDAILAARRTFDDGY